ncbi:MAG: glucose-6-phosphate dehydrogenase [bacterium]|nr:glucose-6-phosphate dehydrogenase [bacterium]
MPNPFLDDLTEKSGNAPSTCLVIFGATGDLTRRKLIPALCNLAQDKYLPSNFVVIGASRSPLSDEDFRASLYEGVQSFSRRQILKSDWDNFAKNVFYHQVRFDNLDDFQALKDRLSKIGKEKKENFNYLYYLATAPKFFGSIAKSLHDVGLVEEPKKGQRTTSIVVEKPFGSDLDSAIKLNAEIRKSFSENQIFRIDHYLGKETVQNILVFRFSNGIFEPLWNHRYIDHIQISVAESVGVESRGEYFDSTGITRDIIQNHVFQVLSLLCIEPPINLDANSIRDEKVKVLKSIRRYKPVEIKNNIVRAQYTHGMIDGKEVLGYTEESKVIQKSQTETFTAMRLGIDNWRWAGVPIYVRAGKRLPKRITEITIFFQKPPEALFKGLGYKQIEQNCLAIQVQPKESISLQISSKPPGPRMRSQPVVMEFHYGQSFGVPSPEAYERLLLDAMKGDATLFTRDDEIEEAWDILKPVFEVWQSESAPPLYRYEAGTWGPKEAADLLRKNNHRWRRL